MICFFFWQKAIFTELLKKYFNFTNLAKYFSNRASVDQAISGSSRPTSVSGSGHSGTAMTLPHPGENEYKFSVKVGDDILRISSTNLQLVKSAKILLEEHYTCNIR